MLQMIDGRVTACGKTWIVAEKDLYNIRFRVVPGIVEGGPPSIEGKQVIVEVSLRSPAAVFVPLFPLPLAHESRCYIGKLTAAVSHPATVWLSQRREMSRRDVDVRRGTDYLFPWGPGRGSSGSGSGIMSCGAPGSGYTDKPGVAADVCQWIWVRFRDPRQLRRSRQGDL